MGRESEPIHPGYVSDSKGIVEQGNPRAIGNLVTRAICKTCNNGWMSDLENEIIPILKPLVSPNFTDFSRESLQPLEDHLALLKRWLLKTAVTLDKVMPSGDLLSDVPQSAPTWSYNNDMPSFNRVYAGWIKDGQFGTQIGRGFRIINGGKFKRNQIHDDSLNFRIQLNHLALRFAIIPEGEWRPTNLITPHRGLCLPRFLGAPTDLRSPKSHSVLFDSFHEFCTSCILQVGEAPEALNSEEYEKMARSIGNLTP